VTKLDGEFYCKFLGSGAGMRTVSLRFFNVFGPRQDPRGSYAAAVPHFISQALRSESLTIFGDGEQTRDFVPVADVVSAMLYAARTPSMRGTYNCGHGRGRTINDLAGTILRLTGSKSRILHGAERLGDVRDSVAAVDRLLGAGWKPQADFDSALKETIASFKMQVSP
jgi:UDP-glucose 4-epimerase